MLKMLDMKMSGKLLDGDSDFCEDVSRGTSRFPTDRGASAAPPSGGNCASGDERTDPWNGKCRNAQARAQRAAAQDAAQDVAMTFVSDFTVAAGRRGRAVVMGYDREFGIIDARGP